MAHASLSEDHHAKEETHPRRDGWPSCAKSISWSRMDGEIFYLLQEAKLVIESWRRHSNSVRPHASLGDQPPAPEVFVPAFAAWPAAPARSRSPRRTSWGVVNFPHAQDGIWRCHGSPLWTVYASPSAPLAKGVSLTCQSEALSQGRCNGKHALECTWWRAGYRLVLRSPFSPSSLARTAGPLSATASPCFVEAGSCAWSAD